MTIGFFEILGILLLFFILLAGLFAVVLGLPGTWIILGASVVYAWFTDFSTLTGKLLLGLLALAVAAELLDLLASSWGARRYGGSKKAMLATLLGGLAGAIVLTPVLFGLGSLLGAFLGAFAGAFSITYMEHRKMNSAVWVGWGALMGRVLSTIFKGMAALTMVGIDVWAIFS